MSLGFDHERRLDLPARVVRVVQVEDVHDRPAPAVAPPRAEAPAAVAPPGRETTAVVVDRAGRLVRLDGAPAGPPTLKVAATRLGQYVSRARLHSSKARSMAGFRRGPRPCVLSAARASFSAWGLS